MTKCSFFRPRISSIWNFSNFYLADLQEVNQVIPRFTMRQNFEHTTVQTTADLARLFLIQPSSSNF